MQRSTYFAAGAPASALAAAGASAAGSELSGAGVSGGGVELPHAKANPAKSTLTMIFELLICTFFLSLSCHLAGDAVLAVNHQCYTAHTPGSSTPRVQHQAITA